MGKVLVRFKKDNWNNTYRVEQKKFGLFWTQWFADGEWNWRGFSSSSKHSCYVFLENTKGQRKNFEYEIQEDIK